MQNNQFSAFESSDDLVHVSVFFYQMCVNILSCYNIFSYKTVDFQLPQQMTVLNLGRPTTAPPSANGFTDLSKPTQTGQTLSPNLWQ